jgi:hypothetical protein
VVRPPGRDLRLHQFESTRAVNFACNPRRVGCAPTRRRVIPATHRHGVRAGVGTCPRPRNSLTVTDFGGVDIGIHQAMRRSMYEEEGLVARCLRGEDTAWEVMFRLYHPRLVSIIKAEMNWQCSTDQAEEIAASIWCSLCSETYSRLRRYDPQIGGLLTYLRALSR